MLTVALVALLGAVGPALLVTVRGDPADRLTGLLLAGPAATLVLLLLAAGYERSSYLDVALVLAVLSFAGTLVFARLLGRTM